MSGARPRSSVAVWAVLGPMQATRTFSGSMAPPELEAGGASAAAKFFTVEELVNVTTSTVPCASRSRTSSAPAPSTTF